MLVEEVEKKLLKGIYVKECSAYAMAVGRPTSLFQIFIDFDDAKKSSVQQLGKGDEIREISSKFQHSVNYLKTLKKF